ncbi:hypothetical protein TRVL_02705 [Trypanosoma vivax]|nr:hypothetical protein TRVL_02705 [Trypanosoma vivax]
MEHLPAIDSRVETARFLYGTLLRLFVQSLAYYGTRGLVSRYVLRRKDSSVWVYRSRVYMGSQAIEIGVSLLVYPMRYLAAVTTPRFILDYTLTNWSDTLRRVDLFSPGKYAAYALRAFTSDSDWNLNFFTWQVPSVALTLAKLWRRRRLLGPSSCRTARILLFFFALSSALACELVVLFCDGAREWR